MVASVKVIDPKPLDTRGCKTPGAETENNTKQSSPKLFRSE